MPPPRVAWLQRLSLSSTDPFYLSPSSNDAQMTWLFKRLDLAVYLTIAWTAGSATGRDFARPGTEIAKMFGPAPRAQDTPDYGQRPKLT